MTKAESEFVRHPADLRGAGVDPAIRQAIHRQELDSALLSAHDHAVVAAVVQASASENEKLTGGEQAQAGQ